MNKILSSAQAEAAASIKRLNGEVLAAIDARDFTAADKLDRQRTALQRGIAANLAKTP